MQMLQFQNKSGVMTVLLDFYPSHMIIIDGKINVHRSICLTREGKLTCLFEKLKKHDFDLIVEKFLIFQIEFRCDNDDKIISDCKINMSIV